MPQGFCTALRWGGGGLLLSFRTVTPQPGNVLPTRPPLVLCPGHNAPWLVTRALTLLPTTPLSHGGPCLPESPTLPVPSAALHTLGGHLPSTPLSAPLCQHETRPNQRTQSHRHATQTRWGPSLPLQPRGSGSPGLGTHSLWKTLDSARLTTASVPPASTADARLRRRGRAAPSTARPSHQSKPVTWPTAAAERPGAFSPERR